MDRQEFFETLLDHIEERRMIPVIGPDLLTVEQGGHRVPLYRAVASRFLQFYDRAAADGEPASDPRAVVLRPGRELNDAVCAVLDDRRDPYSVLPRALNAVLKEAGDGVLAPLQDLASIGAFSLYVTTTLDDLLVRAIDRARHGGLEKTRRVLHVPNLPTDEFRDLTDADLSSAQFTAVLYLFGRARNAQLYALHDEDTLEYVHNLQTRGSNVPERFIARLRASDLLLIGCSLPDWLSRFFLRLSSSERLSDRRPRREFLVGDMASGPEGLVVFLERFSRQTDVLRCEPQAFVADLAAAWRARHPAAPAIGPGAAPRRPAAAEDTVFISYSRTDFAAAERLRQELQAIGIDAVWFDHAALRPGDEWSATIASAIRRSYLFLPLVSAETERRHEGYFREEWRQAAERARQIEGRAFIVPVVIDADYAGDAGVYRLVPEAFRARQFGHAPQGRLSGPLRDHLVALIREYRLTQVA